MVLFLGVQMIIAHNYFQSAIAIHVLFAYCSEGSKKLDEIVIVPCLFEPTKRGLDLSQAVLRINPVLQLVDHEVGLDPGLGFA